MCITLGFILINSLSKTHRLLLIILIEGYVVLACELLAIRELIPFVGSGTEIVSIIISAVLLPLAMGYHAGGKLRRAMRSRLLRNILTALIIFTFGLSYLFLEFFFYGMNYIGIHHRIFQVTCYSIVFLAYPIFLLGQTVPLVSNYFNRSRLSEITGKMLFFSTIGSFLGSIFSTLILMNIVGVHMTVIFTLALLVMLIFILSPRLLSIKNIVAATLLGWLILLNSNTTLQKLHIVSNNAYNLIAIHELPQGGRELSINRSRSSALDAHEKRIYPYIRYVEKIFIHPIQHVSKTQNKPREFLIIGAGGFTLGLDDDFNHYTFVDIDPKLKEIVERYFLQSPLSPNKQFVAASARAFVHQSSKHYDLIFVDTYSHIGSVPMETTTREFLLEVRHRLRQNGVVVVNQIMSPNFNDRFSIRYNNVFESVFPVYTRQIIGDYNPWAKEKEPNRFSNVLYIYFAHPNIQDRTIYTDDKNTYSLDYPI